MPDIVSGIRAEFVRYRALADAAIAQVPDAQLGVADGDGGNSIAIICAHVSGNLTSRFTDFLTADGEKPWRKREEEFAAQAVTRDALMAKWSDGWAVLTATIDSLTDADLSRTVTIRQQPLTVLEALLRSLAHVSYHVGQIVHIGKVLRGREWQYLSIPPGQSDAYNKNPSFESAEGHAAKLKSTRS